MPRIFAQRRGLLNFLLMLFFFSYDKAGAKAYGVDKTPLGSIIIWRMKRCMSIVPQFFLTSLFKNSPMYRRTRMHRMQNAKLMTRERAKSDRRAMMRSGRVNCLTENKLETQLQLPTDTKVCMNREQRGEQ